MRRDGMKNISRNIVLLCPVCGNSQFECLDSEYDDLREAPGDVRMRCSDCGAVYTKDILITENTEKINNAIEEVKNDALKEFEKELKKVFNKRR